MKKENFGQELFIDISQVRMLTIDALMYLLGIINNLKRKFRPRYSFKGNFPQDPRVRDLIRNSGFNKFVRYNGIEPIARDVDSVQIVSGDKVNTRLARRICDFVLSKGNIQKSTTAFLYNMMIELMANVYAHAYNGVSSDILYSRWYCFAEYDAICNTVSFSFMDTGAGIPSTVRKHGLEHIDLLNLTGDGPYVISALKGELRSKTKEPYRGKGLPKIFGYCQRGLIRNMRIITNQGDVDIFNASVTSKELTSTLKGTLFYWQIDLSNLGGKL